MRCRVLLLAAVFAGAELRAAEPVWTPLPGGDAGLFVEIDALSLERHDELLTVWLRLDFDRAVQGRILPFHSALAQHAIDCRQRRHAAFRMTTYSGRLGHGDVIDRWDRSPALWQWRDENSGSEDAALIRAACAQAPATAFSRPMTTSPP